MDRIDLNETRTVPRHMFPPEVMTRLPEILQLGVEYLADPTERGVWLVGALGVISGMLPNIQGLYDGQTVYPNMYVFVVGPYGSGKGALTYARMLAQDVHKARLAETLKAKERLMEGDPEPPQQLHYIPANNSKTGFFELLSGNAGAGTLFESEGDTLADAIRQDYGNFSDGLRKGFHHEPISFYRRTNKEFVEIENPRLSVVLSSTFDQLLTLIPSPENGLFSRFCFYSLPGDPNFRNVFAIEKRDYMTAFRSLANGLKQVYDGLSQLSEPIVFRLTKDQEARFVERFQALKTELRETNDANLDGTVNRLGLQFFRVAMILTALRSNGDSPMYCTDQDFDLAGEIVDVLTQHAIDIYFQLPQPKTHNSKHIERAEDIKRALELSKAGQTYGAISQAIFGDESHKSTVHRWINQK